MIRENQKLLNRINVISDSVIMLVSITLSYFIRFIVFEGMQAHIEIGEYLKWTVFMIPAQIVIFYQMNLYDSFRSKTFHRECTLLVTANLLLTGIFLGCLFIFRDVNISRWVLTGFFCFNLLFMILKRYVLRKTLCRLRSTGKNLKTLMIIGSGEIADAYLKELRSKPEFGYRYCGYAANSPTLSGEYLGRYRDLPGILEKYDLDEVVCALDISEAGELEHAVNCCEQSGTKISIIPFCYKYIPSQPAIDQMGNIPLINIRRIPLDNIGNAFIKRAMDIVGSLVLIILSSPVMLFAAVGIKLTSKGPIIFKQERVGLNKKVFTMYKFRSMRVNASEQTGWTTNDDPRKTKFGSFIRKCSIDELPQFFNVLKGDMSLVGPRPELPHFVESFQKEIPLYMVKHQVKPGITGWAQVNGFRGDTSIVKRIEHDIHYIENWDLFFDISILFRTVFKGMINDEVVFSKGKEKEDGKEKVGSGVRKK